MISLQGLQPNSWLISRLPFSDAFTLAALRLKIPRSPDLDSYNDVHSRMNVPISGLPLNATELLAKALCPSFSHHEPDLACLIWSSPKLDKEIRADLRTPPTTTTSPILHMIS